MKMHLDYVTPMDCEFTKGSDLALMVIHSIGLL